MKIIIVTLLIITQFFSQVLAGKSIEVKVETYLNHIKKQEFSDAANYMHPEHLKKLKSYLLPLMIKLSRQNNHTGERITEVFFNDVEDEKKGELSEKDVFAATFRINQNENSLSGREYEFEVIEIHYSPDHTRATVHYSISKENIKFLHYEILEKFEGSWYLAPKQDLESLRNAFERFLK